MNLIIKGLSSDNYSSRSSTSTSATAALTNSPTLSQATTMCAAREVNSEMRFSIWYFRFWMCDLGCVRIDLPAIALAQANAGRAQASFRFSGIPEFGNRNSEAGGYELYHLTEVERLIFNTQRAMYQH